MSVRPLTFETALLEYPLAPEQAQLWYDRTWKAQYADQFNSVRELAPGLYAVGDEDLRFADGTYGQGLFVFVRDADFQAKTEIPLRPGWSVRLTLLVRQHTAT